jgi:hypothetical protein
MTPVRTFHEVAEHAIIFAYLCDGRLNAKCSRVGQYYQEQVTDEQKELLRNLSAADVASTSRIFLSTLPDHPSRTTVHNFK